MKNSTKAFTLIELVVSITLFTILMGASFGIFPYVTGTIKKLGNEHFLLRESINFKEELTFNNKNVAFYSYSDINSITTTQYDFENMYRNNINNLISNTLVDKYALAEFRFDNPGTCKLPYSSEQYFNEGETAILEDEFLLGSCNNLISSPLFDSEYKILSVIDRKSSIVNIYFSYDSVIHKITTSLIKDLSNDNIIYTQLNSGKIQLKTYNGFEINKFTGNSYNYCTQGDKTSGECSFTDFQYELGKSANLYVNMYKMTLYGGEIQIKSSYILKTIYSLNY